MTEPAPGNLYGLVDMGRSVTLLVPHRQHLPEPERMLNCLLSSPSPGLNERKLSTLSCHSRQFLLDEMLPFRPLRHSLVYLVCGSRGQNSPQPLTIPAHNPSSQLYVS